MPSVPCTSEVIAGTVAIGGSESSVMTLARALVARGHDVSLYALGVDVAGLAEGRDAHGVRWYPMEQLSQDLPCEEWDVFVAVRAYGLFLGPRVHARLRLLWNHDLLTPGMVPGVMAAATQVDAMLYVSAYHQTQWEGLAPFLTGLGALTRNVFDPSLVPSDVEKDPNRILFMSRPERGLGPLLAMWPALKAAHPDATLGLCRYSVPADGGVRADTMKGWDLLIADAHQAVGGIEVLGGLAKPDLYRELARAAVLWYPGVADFAETSCLAAIEAQACGTPIVASYRGALPETAAPAWHAGCLVTGDPDSETYQTQSVALVAGLLRQCRDAGTHYRTLQAQGREQALGYTSASVAAAWETMIERMFADRVQARPIRVVRALLHEDDHVAAKVAANVMLTGSCWTPADVAEAQAALARCDEVITGRECTPEHYGQFAMADPLQEGRESDRLKAAVERFVAAGVTRVLDVACGNGAFAIALALALPDVHVVGVDASAQNIRRAKAAAMAAGVTARVDFHEMAVIDLADQRQLTAAWRAFVASGARFDGLFCGEFLEHVQHTDGLIDGLETALADHAFVLYTVPHGPWAEPAPRNVERHQGHVHRFAADDIRTVFREKAERAIAFRSAGETPRGLPLGHWFVSYRTAAGCRAHARDLDARTARTRPYEKLSVGLIAHNAAADLARCLESVWWIADQIVVGDTGSVDETVEIAKRYGATVLHLPKVQDFEDGFAGARNAVLDACDGDWFLWIDADEILIGGQELRKHLESGPFQGLILKQHHLAVDLPPQFDTPIRVFRRRPEIRFFGCIHEMPGFGDANTDIKPTLELGEVALAHTGYLTEGVRRAKTLGRNMPLMAKDRARFPDRKLGALLVLRDEVVIADLLREQAQGYVTQEAEASYRRAIALYDAHCADPANGLHSYARPWYERAVTALKEGFDVAWALAGSTVRSGGVNLASVRPERFVVRSAEELERLVQHEFVDIRKAMHPPPLETTPVADPDAVRNRYAFDGTSPAAQAVDAMVGAR